MIKTKITKKILSLAFALCCLFLLAILIINMNRLRVNGANDHAYMKFSGFDSTQPEGSEAHPFIILEIVPHRGIGQFGYVVGGQEPVDLAAIQAMGELEWGRVIGLAQDSFVIDASGPYKYKNAELFRKKILGVDENYHIRVVTITPDKLNENVEKFSKYYDLSCGGINNKLLSTTDIDGEIDLIANADLITISPKGNSGPLDELWRAYGRDTSGADYSKISFKDAGNDISWQTAMELFMKVGMVTNKAALVYDYRIMTTDDVSYSIESTSSINLTAETGKGYSSNIYKLCLMLKQYDPEVFFDMYLDPNSVSGGARVVAANDGSRATGSITILDEYNNPAPSDKQLNAQSRIYWGEHTFLPKSPYGTLANVGGSWEYQKYLNDNNIIYSYVAGTASYQDAVVRNVYHYNGGTSVIQYFDFLSREDLCVKEDKDGTGYEFNKELIDWLEEDKGIRPSKATPLEAIRYVLNMSRTRSRDINILELQPCKDFSLTVDDIKLMIPGIKGDITIEQQTTSEFIGKLDDLNSSYDMIYIGANSATLNRDAYGNTVYNDPALDGLIYLHVGDRMLAYDALNGAMRSSSGTVIKARDQIVGSREQIMKGLISEDGSLLNIETGSIDFYRFSGNDITMLKYQELKEFSQAGYPVIFDEKLLNSSDDSLIDINLVDDSSNIFRFLQEGINDPNSSIISSSCVASNLSWIKDRLTSERLSVTMIDAPMDYTGDISTRIAGRSLSFKFSINKADYIADSKKYNWALYVDNNADGKYSSEEMIRHGSNVSHSSVIEVSHNLPEEDYADVIAWILKINEAGNEVIRTQVEGMAAFSQSDDDRKTINVLQISSDKSTIHLADLLNPSAGKTTLFYEYTKNLKDFKLDVTTIKVSDFLNKYNPNNPYYGVAFDPYDPMGTSKFIITIDGEKKYYDMLILGFGDCYTDINNGYNALDDITHFIQTGRSVMFTHDTTSFVNMEKSSFTPVGYGLEFWGYGINQFFRITLGLDRYGVMKKAGDTTQYDMASMPGQAKDIYGGQSQYPERQGLSYPVLMAYSNPGPNDIGSYNPYANNIHDANKLYPVFSIGNNFKIGNNITNYQTKKVSKVNDGQITSYPYMIPDEFNIGRSHAQYYELNMEDDEITVWFCLSDDNPNGKGPYSISPNDVRNNYYIYNKKNIMYTVVGHEPIDKEYTIGTNSSFGEYEVKLFINCMIASYQASLKGPEVIITNSDARLNTSGEYIMMSNTENFESSDLPAPTKTITFMAKNPNLTATNLSARIYRYNSLGEATLIKPEVFLKGSTIKAHASIDGESVIIEAYREYAFDLTLGASNEYINGMASIYIEVSDDDEHLRSGAKASVIPLKLFELD